MKKLGVLFFPFDRTGSTFYRLLQPAQKLDQYGLCQVGIVGPSDPVAMRFEAIKISDVLMFHSSASPEMAEQFYAIRKAGKKIVMDMNDDIFHISPYSVHYRTLGTEEAVHVNPKGEFIKLWEDGVTINIEANKKRLKEQ